MFHPLCLSADAPPPPLLNRDIDGAKPAMGAVDVEGHGAALVKLAGGDRQVGAVHEHVA
jgi:hypothetical protein